jgi:hypothetical protein
VKPEPQRDAASAPTAPALKLRFNIERLLKMPQTLTVSYFSGLKFYKKKYLCTEAFD